MNLPKRKSIRLKGYNYNSPGAYFITICVKDRKELLSKIDVGKGVLDCPQNNLTLYGKIAEKHLFKMSNFYENIKIDKFVVMPNHIHMLVRITNTKNSIGPSGTTVPTNSLISRFIGTFKRFCNKEYGENIWQNRSHDHVIRNEKNNKKIWKYIDTNEIRWDNDCFYVSK